MSVQMSICSNAFILFVLNILCTMFCVCVKYDIFHLQRSLNSNICMKQICKK